MNYNEQQIDALTEIINIGAGRAAGSLSDLIGERIELSVPFVQIGPVDEMTRRFSTLTDSVETAVIQDFRGGLHGRALLAFPHDSGVKLGQLILGVELAEGELTEDISGVLEEVGNIVLNGVLGSLSNMASTDLSYSVPKLSVGQSVERIITTQLAAEPGVAHYLLMADTRFNVAKRNIDGSLVLVLDATVLDTVLNAVLGQPV